MKINMPEHRPTQIAITKLALEIVTEMGMGNADFDYAVKNAALKKIARDYREWQAAELARLIAEEEAVAARISVWRGAVRDSHSTEFTLTRNQRAAMREPMLPIAHDGQREGLRRIHITTPEYPYPGALCVSAVGRGRRPSSGDGLAGLGWFGFTAALFTLPEDLPEDPQPLRNSLGGGAYIHIADMATFSIAQHMSIEQAFSGSAPELCARCEEYFMRYNPIKPLAIA